MKTLKGGRGQAPELRRYKDVGWRSGNMVFPYDEGPLHQSWPAPLDAVSRVAAGNPRFPFYDPADAMASLGAGPHRSGNVARAMGKTTSQVGPVRDALLRRGLLWSPRYGEIAFTVPLFDEFLRRNRGRA